MVKSQANPLAPSHRPILTLAKKHQPAESESAQYRVQVYHSGRWVNHVRPAKAKRDPLCQWCAYEGIVKPMKHVDHWVPLAQGGAPYDDDNLVSLCHSHHSRKTALEQAGKPLPQIIKSAVRHYDIA
jgi:5-methylcytosine-specific restriction endonuclease McrA